MGTALQVLVEVCKEKRRPKYHVIRKARRPVGHLALTRTDSEPMSYRKNKKAKERGRFPARTRHGTHAAAVRRMLPMLAYRRSFSSCRAETTIFGERSNPWYSIRFEKVKTETG